MIHLHFSPKKTAAILSDYKWIFTLFFMSILLSFFHCNVEGAVKPISQCSITMPYTAIQYTGAAMKPVPSITDQGKVLVNNTDFTLTYADNKALGKASVTIQGKGNYTGSVVKTFSIVKMPLSRCKITLTPPYFVYDGNPTKEKIPVVTVKNGNSVLTLNVSYRMEITNNQRIGFGYINLYGIGNYTGTAQASFSIGPGNTKVTSATATSSSVTLSWQPVANIDGYYIYKYNSSKKTYTKAASVSKTRTTFTIDNLTPGTRWILAVKAYKKSSTGTVTSPNGAKVIRTTPMVAVSNFKCVKSSKDSIYLSWNKVSGASGYKIYSYNYKTKVFKAIKTIKWNASSCVVTGLKESTHYGLGIKAYHKNSGAATQYSPKLVKAAINTKHSYADQSLYIDGDSIAYGTGAGGYSYANELAKLYGFKLVKKATPGSTLSTAPKDCDHILDSVKNNVKQKYNYAIIEGGVNDYLRSIKVGSLSSSGSFDTKTTAGALEAIFSHFKTKYPGTKVYFLIPHKIYDNGVGKRNIVNGKKTNFFDVHTTPNLAGYTYTAYYSMFLKVCSKYNVKVINMYTKSNIDATNATDRKLYTADQDGIHPTKNVQISVYAPTAASVMGLK